MSSSVAICVTGWHFPRDFYTQINQLTQADIFVISHKQPEQVPGYVLSSIERDRIYYEPNLGYDWGCYQQFLNRQLWQQYPYLIFMHDDVVIKHNGFLERSIELLNQGYSVIGNGRPGPKQPWPVLSAESYAYASWQPPQTFQHQVVRGSFFATTCQALKILGHFEVFGDRFQLTSGFGNWSLKASCGKWEYLCGATCFHYLSDSYCTSEYLDENVRGEISEPRASTLSRPQKRITNIIAKSFRFYMNLYWQPDSAKRSLWLQLMRPYITWIAGPSLR